MLRELRFARCCCWALSRWVSNVDRFQLLPYAACGEREKGAAYAVAHSIYKWHCLLSGIDIHDIKATITWCANDATLQSHESGQAAVYSIMQRCVMYNGVVQVVDATL